ncbi:MAG: hypothetical protein JWN44_7021 [Myxococcales bacterium]|nr:hypothetical protein [Myxococcales bacterium]
MLWLLSALFLVLWLIGMVTGHTLGAGVHLLLALAMVTVCASLLRPHMRDSI